MRGRRAMVFAVTGLTLGGSRAVAQTVPPPWAFGVVAGFTSASLSGDSPASTKYRGQRGFTGAVLIERRVAPEVAISIQPGFTRRNTGIAFQIPGEDEPRDSLSLELDYVTLPILVKVFSSSGRAYVAGGTDIGWSLSGTLSGAGAPIDVSTAIRDIDVAGVFAFGVTFPVGPPRLAVELRYVQSILNASTGDAPADSAVKPRFRSKGLQLTLGITMALGNHS